MFKGISINLSGPICDCAWQDLSFQFTEDSIDSDIIIECNLCHIYVCIPKNKLNWHFVLKTNYPEQKPEYTDNVIPFPTTFRK